MLLLVASVHFRTDALQIEVNEEMKGNLLQLVGLYNTDLAQTSLTLCKCPQSRLLLPVALMITSLRHMFVPAPTNE